jgi:prepilin-type processing-associated H-X9-DG protein
VVISIIALLLSILLPALNKAKEQAKLSVCMSNMKQLGYTVKIYMEDNQHRFPYGGALFDNGEGEFAWGGADDRMPTYNLPPAEERLFYSYAKGFDVFSCPADKGQNLLPWSEGYWKPSNFYALGNSYRYNYYPWGNPTMKLNNPDEDVKFYIANKKESWAPHPSRYILLHEPPALKWQYGNKYFLWHFARGETTLIGDPTLARSPFVSNILFVDGHAGTFDFTDTFINPTTGNVNEYICEPTADWVWYKPG